MFTSDSDTASPADARKLALSYLRVHCPDADVEAVQIVLSELVTNAVRHTVTGSWSLDLRYDNSHGDGIGLLTLRVHDRDIRLPRQRDDSSIGWHPLDGRGGLGLLLVQKLTDQVGVERTRNGKTITVQWKLA
ncbi:ATP-binding protein [Streptomyces sp. NPDC088788]|uniref:ATP-binding protein n=1 Tax=Streptomyces sp. NPDC088788 TaxID=3365898 RepID=UPI003812478F